MTSPTGAQVIARSLHDLGVTVLFGIVGIPVVEIADECISEGIQFIGFRNEQAAGYAASVYGYLTGKPGVCLVVGGPGVLHAMAGVGNSWANAFPMLLLAGSSETHLTTKGAFQELDAISLLTPHIKLAVRPPDVESIPDCIKNAYRASYFGRPGTGYVDFPADIIKGAVTELSGLSSITPLPSAPKSAADPAIVLKAASLIRAAKSPLVVVGKGAAYAQAERAIRSLIDKTSLPFLPTPMGKGVIPDSHPCNTASARSTALQNADVVLVLGARLNWILHFGDAPKWNPEAKFIQVDISAEELGRNAADPSLGLLGDLNVVVDQIARELGSWRYNPSTSDFISKVQDGKRKNEDKAAKAAKNSQVPLKYAHAFDVIKSALHSMSPPEDGDIVYVSEGANTMDISRSAFPVEHPRLRLDAGTHATMGVGLGYAIAAHAAYNSPAGEASPAAQRKKIVALEGDSAFGFSAMEVETMARYNMDVLIFVMNNGGVYHGDSSTADEWLERQKKSLQGKPGKEGLRSTSLGWEVGYEKLAEACGGLGFLVRTPEELEKATREGFKAKVPCVVNVIIEAGAAQKLEFGWQASANKQKKQAKL